MIVIISWDIIVDSIDSSINDDREQSTTYLVELRSNLENFFFPS